MMAQERGRSYFEMLQTVQILVHASADEENAILKWFLLVDLGEAGTTNVMGLYQGLRLGLEKVC